MEVSGQLHTLATACREEALVPTGWGDRVAPGLCVVVRRKTPCPCQGLNPSHSAHELEIGKQNKHLCETQKAGLTMIPVLSFVDRSASWSFSVWPLRQAVTAGIVRRIFN